MRQERLPVHRQELPVRDERIDVAGERERDAVCLQTIDDSTCLFAGATVRLLDLDVLPGLLLPVRRELPFVFLVELARGVGGNVQERRCCMDDRR